ncbi:hypothetical protein ZWY2020_022732 [Hordeum vulgare]|nr:hypothetical protein ZWY2020_022732 [Hordeum vulgare]
MQMLSRGPNLKCGYERRWVAKHLSFRPHPPGSNHKRLGYSGIMGTTFPPMTTGPATNLASTGAHLQQLELSA